MATREIIELPDKHTGDINEIRDKKIALASEASGATDITAQCEYLIKNGQTGEFMNVLKSYIDESVRAAMVSLINNYVKSQSTLKSVACIDNSNDFGTITPSELASVLGERSFHVHTADHPVLTVQRDSPGYDCFIHLVTGSSAQTTFQFGIAATDAGSYWKYDLRVIGPNKTVVLADNL